MIKVTTNFVPKRKSGYFTPGKVYDAKPSKDSINGYHVTSDVGEVTLINVACCAHLDMESWTVVEGG